jgi:ATP/maltotriose-dependent transcriptional regulator MalT
MLRITSIWTQHEFLRGRLALSGSDDPRRAERHARKLAGADFRPARVWALTLRGGAAIARGERERAAQFLEQAEAAATEIGMKLTAAVARRRRAELRGDEAASIEAAAEMATLGIRAPAKMTALLVPVGQAP